MEPVEIRNKVFSGYDCYPARREELNEFLTGKKVVHLFSFFDGGDLTTTIFYVYEEEK